MSDFDQLGEALGEQLHAIVEDLHPSAELSAAVDALPSKRRARWAFLGRLSRRRIAIAVPVPIAGIVAAVLLLAGSGPGPSVAGGLVVLPSGSIRVTPTEIANPAAANASLRQHHIHNIVVVPMTASCAYHDWNYSLGGYTLGYQKKYGRTLGAMFLTPSTIPKGYTVVLAAKQVTRESVLTAASRFRGRKLPTCASSHGTGPVLRLGDTLPANRAKLKKSK
jgi:hypothetical protein